MKEKQYQDLYNSFTYEELKEVLPKAKGSWEQDKKLFIKIQEDLDNMMHL